MLEINELLNAISWQAVGLAALVVLVVELGKLTKLIKSGDWSRYATMVLSALLSGLDAGDPETVAFAAVVMAIASGAHELLELLRPMFAKLVAFIKAKYEEYLKAKKAKK